MQKVLSIIDSSHDDTSKVKINVLDAMHFVRKSWHQVTTETIKNCFIKAGFSNFGQEAPEKIIKRPACCFEENLPEWNEFYLSDIKFSDYVDCDALLQTCEIQSVNVVLDEQIAANMSGSEDDDDETEPKLSTFSDETYGMQSAKNYLKRFDVKYDVFHALQKLETAICKARFVEKIKQPTIMKYFSAV